VYPWVTGTGNGFGTKRSNPSTLPGGGVSAGGIAFNPAGNVIFLACTGSPYIHAYDWDETTGIGTKRSNPSTLPANAIGVDCSPSGGAVVVTQAATSPYFRAYAWDDASGFGALYSAPSTLPGSSYTYRPKFSPWVTA
jgi:hypothetical protein